jgi:hypothetical protein
MTTTLFATALWCQDLSRQGAEAMRTERYTEAERIYRELIKQRQTTRAGMAIWDWLYIPKVVTARRLIRWNEA